MNKERALFSRFLEDHRVYSLNKYYWSRLVSSIGKEEIISTDIYQNFFADGRPIADGNPIFSALLAGGKSLRIIQEEPEGENLHIGAWVTKANEIDEQLTDELVISLELSIPTRDLARELIQTWIDKQTTPEKMEEVINAKLPFAEAA